MTNDKPASGAQILASGPVAAFMARVLDDPAAQARLAVPIAMEDYVVLAVAIAQDYGIALTAANLDEHLRLNSLGLGRFGPAPVTLDRWPGSGWVPARSIPGDAGPAFDWMWIGDAPFSGSFYEDTVRRAMALPFNRMFRTRTSRAALVRDAAGHDVAPPTGLVFHMSRCGSTLAGRMLMAVPGHAVASEPEPLDAVIQWATLSGASQDEQIAALRAIVGALGRDRTAGQRRFFIKFDAWHVLALPLLRAAFPHVPWIFLYRDPVEVIVSHLAEPGLHFVPGMLPPALIGLDTSDWTSLADYGARVLAQICGAVVEHWPLGGGLLVRFDDIYAAMTTTVPAHFGFQPRLDERAAMTAATAVDAKRPSARFTPDSTAKQKMATSEVSAAAAMHFASPIASLDKLRADDIR